MTPNFEALYRELKSAAQDFFAYPEYSGEKAESYATITAHISGRAEKAATPDDSYYAMQRAALADAELDEDRADYFDTMYDVSPRAQ